MRAGTTGTERRASVETPTIEQREIHVDGLRVPFRCVGPPDAEPVVLLHGAGEGSGTWQGMMGALAKSYRLYAPELLLFSATPTAVADCSSRFFERLAHGFLDGVGLGRAVLVGHSLGGLVALRLALAAPERVTALALVAAGGLGREIGALLRLAITPGTGELATLWARTPMGAWQRAWIRALALLGRPPRAPVTWFAEQRRLAQTPGFLDATLAALRAHIDAGGQREIFTREFHRITAPTLIVWGRHDRVVPASQGQAAAGGLRDARLVLLDDAGHLPHVEHPRLVAEALEAFLASRMAGAARPAPPTAQPPR